MAYPLGRLQLSVLARVADTPAAPGSDVYDLRGLSGRVQSNRHAVSRAVHRLVERGVLEWMRPAASGFRPDDGWECKVRYVRRGSGL
jgi:DNA-binding MarR family transcriptional regulator